MEIEVVLKALKILYEDELGAALTAVETQWASPQIICEDWTLPADPIPLEGDKVHYVVSGTDIVPVEGRFPAVFIFGWDMSPVVEYEQELTGRWNYTIATRLIGSGDNHEILEKYTMRWVQAILNVLKADPQIKHTVPGEISNVVVAYTGITPGMPLFKAAQITFLAGAIDVS